MKTRFMNILDVDGIETPMPESMKELRKFVSDDDDLFYLALRGFEQNRMTCIRSQIKRGESEEKARKLAMTYHYHRQTRT